MSDSFRANAAKERDAAADIEARLSRLMGHDGDDDAPRKKTGGVRLLTEEKKRDEDFRIACGAFVKGRIKPGVRQKYDMSEAERLRSAGADVNGADDDGWTGLHWAAAEGYQQVVKFLVDPERGANIDAVDKEGSGAISAKRVCALFAAANRTPTAQLQQRARLPGGRGHP